MVIKSEKLIGALRNNTDAELVENSRVELKFFYENKIEPLFDIIRNSEQKKRLTFYRRKGGIGLVIMILIAIDSLYNNHGIHIILFVLKSLLMFLFIAVVPFLVIFSFHLFLEFLHAKLSINKRFQKFEKSKNILDNISVFNDYIHDIIFPFSDNSMEDNFLNQLEKLYAEIVERRP